MLRGGSPLAHFLMAILGVWLLFLILRSMIRIALMNRHSRDFFAKVTCRAVYAAVALRLGASRDIRTTHPVLLWFFPVYMLSLTVVYFLGAMAAFTLLYWGTRAVGTWHQALLASGSALNTLGFATPTTIAGQWLAVPEGALGLGIVVFLFTFIPGYQAVIRAREDKTAWLYVRVGDQPNGARILEWCQTNGPCRQYERCMGSLGRLVPYARRHALGITDAKHVAFGAEWPVVGRSCGRSA